MVALYLAAVFAVVLFTMAAFELLIPALTRRDMLFGVTLAPGVRDSAAGRAIIRGYRFGVVALTVLAGAGLVARVALAPADWWTSGSLALLGIVVALLPCVPYLPAHVAARRLCAPAGAGLPGNVASGASVPAAELRPRHYAEYVPWVWEALPLGIIAATAAHLAAGYAAAPAIIPLRFGATGQPNAYAAKTILSYFSLVWTQLVLEAMLTGPVIALRTGQGGARLPNASPSDRLADRYWRLGWTLNFGNPLSWLLWLRSPPSWC